MSRAACFVPLEEDAQTLGAKSTSTQPGNKSSAAPALEIALEVSSPSIECGLGRLGTYRCARALALIWMSVVLFIISGMSTVYFIIGGAGMVEGRQLAVPPPVPLLPPLPLPPSPPPPSPLSPVPVAWEKLEGKNCWWDGHGAEEVDLPKGSAVGGATTVEQCQAACVELNHGYPRECDGILVQNERSDEGPMSKGSISKCFRKARIDPQRCSDDAAFTLYLRKDMPPLPPTPPPFPRAPPFSPSDMVDRINERFRRPPYEEALWHTQDEGALADAGVLIHLFDEWEEHADGRYHYWHADEFMRPDLSCSLIWAGQRAEQSPGI